MINAARVLLGLLASSAIPAVLGAQPDTTSRSVAAGVRIGSVLRIATFRGDSAIGWFRGLQGDTILLRDRDRNALSLPTSSVSSVDLGETRFGERVARGTAIGVGVGVLVGMIWLADPGCTDSCISPSVAAVAGGIPFGVIGALLGVVVGGTTIGGWRRIYPSPNHP